MMPLESAQRWIWLHCKFWSVRIINVPDVWILRHVWRFLLETELGVCDSDTVLTSINFPVKLSNCSFYLVGVFEYHKSFCVDFICHSFSWFRCEIFFEKIYFVILANATFSCSCQILRGFSVSRIFGELFLISRHLHVISVVIILRPATNIMRHTLVFGFNSLSVDSMNRHDWDVV